MIVKQRLNQFSDPDFKDNLFIPDNEFENLLYEKLIPGFALKSNQKIGEKVVTRGLI